MPAPFAPVSVTPEPLPTPPVSPTPVPHGPVSAFGFSVADDRASHRVVLFGGVDSYDDTWLWDGSRWSHAVPSISPPGRFHAAAAYDPSTELVMLFGGREESGALLNDTWAWNGTGWRELDSGRQGPSAIEGALMAWDEAARSLVLVTPGTTGTGGETWTWNGSTWLRRTGGDLPTTPIAGEMAFDPVSRALLFVSPLTPPSGVGISAWRWDGSSWHRWPAVPPIATTGLTLDPSSGRLLLCAEPTSAGPARLWSWSGAVWAPVPNSQLSVELDTEASDADHGQLLMFGFVAPSTQLGPQPVHVWGWNGRAWRQLDS